jgi:SNF2 family DNA or RNA helicase
MSELPDKDTKWWKPDASSTRQKKPWYTIFFPGPDLRVSGTSTKPVSPLQAEKPGLLYPFVATPVKNIDVNTPVFPGIHKSAGKLVESDRGVVAFQNIPADTEPVPPVTTPSSREDRIWEKLRIREVEPHIPLSKRLSYLLQSPGAWRYTPLVSLKWPHNPFPYQMEGIKILIRRDSLLLADDMGLGKTIQVIAALRLLFQRQAIERTLIVVPAGLVTQWRKEIRLWAPELRISTIQGPPGERAYQWNSRAQVFLTGYETLREDFTSNPQSPPRRVTWDVVVLDEAQKIKNRETEISRKCKRLLRKRAWAITGTPLENSPDDLASILEFTRPLGPEEEPLHITPGLDMRELQRDIQLRRKKRDVLPELPPKTVSTITLPLEREQWETYRKAEKDGIIQLREKGQYLRIENVLELILRLKQICNFCPRTGRSSKLDDIRNRLATLVSEGHRALIFSQFIDDKFGAKAILKNLRTFSPLVYTGEITATQKNLLVNQFKANDTYKVLVLSVRAGGQGLNLQEASYVFHFDRWWNPAVEHQADDRAHRLGQISPVHVYQYTCENTIEERIEQILSQKQKLFDELVDDVSIDLAAHLTSEEIFGLFGMKPPDKRFEYTGGDK